MLCRSPFLARRRRRRRASIKQDKPRSPKRGAAVMHSICFELEARELGILIAS
jgi:hypothetical protein